MLVAVAQIGNWHIPYAILAQALTWCVSLLERIGVSRYFLWVFGFGCGDDGAAMQLLVSTSTQGGGQHQEFGSVEWIGGGR